MTGDVPQRLWLPLLILETTGPLYSKTKFQKLAFLAQYEAKIDEYDFIKHHYGPYSDGLDLDTVCYPSLIIQNISFSYNVQSGHYYSYYITKEGQSILSELRQELEPQLVQQVADKVRELNSRPLCELLEEVYTKFALGKDDSKNLELEVKDELMKILPPIHNSYLKFGNRQATFVAAILEIIDQVVLKAGDVEDTVQKGVMLNLSKEIIQKCKELAKEITPPADSGLLRPRFLEIGDLFRFLMQYCENRNIMENPLSKPLEDIMTEDEAIRLSKALEEAQLPS